MLKKIIITYYAACYLIHKNHRYYEKGFTDYWFSAFVMVAESAFAFLMIILVLIEGIFGIRPVFISNRPVFILIFAIIPAALLYYLIFHKEEVDKNAADEYFDYLEINKKKRGVASFFFIFINVFMLLTLYIVYS